MSDQEFLEVDADCDGYASDVQDEYAADANHKSLIENISTLNLPDKVRKRKIRNEPREINEFNLVGGNRNKVNLNQLTQVIKGAGTDETVGKIKKVAKKLATKKVLDKPLEKVYKDRIERSVNFETTSKEVSRWEPVVLQNRVAEELHFPLEQPDNRIENALERNKRFKPKTDLEKEIQSILDSSENFLDDDVGMTEAEEKALKAMSIEEARARHQELRKARALLSYREAKLHRQNKIKSKAYRKILKRDKVRKSMKEFEHLKQNDPAKALEKLQELEKLRIRERATLKHLKTGKWTKVNKLRAKYDKDARDKLTEQMNLNKDLVRKLYEESEPSEASEDDLDEQIKHEKNDLLHKVNDRAVINEGEEQIDEQNQEDEPFNQNYSNLVEKMNVEELQRQQKESKRQKKKKNRKLNKASLVGQQQTEVEEASASGEETDMDSDQEQEQMYKQLVSEALAEDDVIEDFNRDKRETATEEQGKDKDNFLPGWGRWGGAGIEVNNRIRKKYVDKAAKVIRKDRNMKNVIISEKKDQVIAKYLPKSLPAGVTDKTTYEKKIAKPIGSTWNPETIFKNIVKPSVTTKLGTKIKPMNEKVLSKAKRIYDKDFNQKVNEIIKLS